MQTESLKYLLAIQQAGSTRKAADLLNTSSQNVSRVLKQLEEECGKPLFFISLKISNIFSYISLLFCLWVYYRG